MKTKGFAAAMHTPCRQCDDPHLTVGGCGYACYWAAIPGSISETVTTSQKPTCLKIFIFIVFVALYLQGINDFNDSARQVPTYYIWLEFLSNTTSLEPGLNNNDWIKAMQISQNISSPMAEWSGAHRLFSSMTQCCGDYSLVAISQLY